MPKERKSGPSSSSIEISNLARAYGITRDQARRLINRFGNNRVKLSEAARILKARLPPRPISQAENSDWRGKVWSPAYAGFDLVFKVKTEKAIGLTVPPTLLALRRRDRIGQLLAAVH
jgi:hypothetical protein